MPGLAPYLVAYKFRLLWAECTVSDLPEEIQKRLAFPCEVTAVAEDQNVGSREYLVTATVQAEDCDRALGILHRLFAYLPGAVVLRFAVNCLDESRGEKILRSDDLSEDLFPGAGGAPLPSPVTTDPATGKAYETVPGWSVALRVVINERASDVGALLEKRGVSNFTVLEDRGGSVLVRFVSVVPTSIETKELAVMTATENLTEKLQGVVWSLDDYQVVAPGESQIP